MPTFDMNSTNRNETPWSKTLAIAEIPPKKTVCMDCQNAVWYSSGVNTSASVEVYCKLMHSVMLPLSSCDGQTPHEVGPVPVPAAPLVAPI
mgnify:CR=1 FL=1